jgi:CelD/BcsL family acetyltransferase involved in cellulose biosynthesis
MKAQGEHTKAKPRPTGQRLDTAVLRDATDFASLEEEWDDLYRHSPRATPFQSWAWLYSWWESYGGEGYELRLVTVRDGEGLLVGILPLMLERRWCFGRLLLVGSGLSDYLDVLVREGWEVEVASAGVRALRQMCSWHLADLQELRPQAAAWDISRGWEGPQACLWQNNCIITDLKPWDELLGSLSKDNRKVARRSLRRAEEDGVRPRLVDAEDTEEAARSLVALHRESWRGRGIGLEHATRRFEALVEVAAHRMRARGLGSISEFRRDNEVVVSNFFVFGHDFIGGYISGATQKILRRYQVSSLFIWDAMNIARSKNLSYLNHLRGEESYKLRWSSRVVPNHRLILGRNTIVLATYAGYQRLRTKVEAHAGSENAPRWIRKTVIRYRDLRSKATRRVKRMSR